MEESSKIQQYHLHKEHPEKLQFDIYDLRSYLDKSGAHATKPHSHSFYQILWVFNKGGVHYIDFDEHTVGENTMFFIAKNQIHYFDDSAKHEGILIHFNEIFLLQSDVDIFLKYNVFNNKSKPLCCLDSESIEIANHYISMIKSELPNRKEFGHSNIIRNLLKSLLIVLERSQRVNSDSNFPLTNQYELQFLQFREHIEQYYNTGYTVSDYANLLHVSPKTLTTITKNVSGKSPSKLISERIILEAQRLLSFTSLKINEIGYQLGFEDASYFVKYFKRHLKKSPTDYRKMTSV